MPESDYELRAIARKRIEERRGVVPHLLTYILVNGGLVLLWATVAGRGFFWPAFVLAPWGIGLVMHIWSAYFRTPITETDIDREVERLSGHGPSHA